MSQVATWVSMLRSCLLPLERLEAGCPRSFSFLSSRIVGSDNHFWTVGGNSPGVGTSTPTLPGLANYVRDFLFLQN